MTLTMEQRADRANGKKIKPSFMAWTVPAPPTKLDRRVARANGKPIKPAATTPAEIALERRAARVNGQPVDDPPSDSAALHREYAMARRAAGANGAKALAKFNDSPLARQFERAAARDQFLSADSDSSFEFPLAVEGVRTNDGRTVSRSRIADWSRGFTAIDVTDHTGSAVAKLLSVSERRATNGKAVLLGRFDHTFRAKGFFLETGDGGRLVGLELS